jgi:hypothetical protein
VIFNSVLSIFHISLGQMFKTTTCLMFDEAAYLANGI